MLHDAAAVTHEGNLGPKQLTGALEGSEVAPRQVAQDSEQHDLVATKQLMEQITAILILAELPPQLLRLERLVEHLERTVRALKRGPKRPIHAGAAEADDAASVAASQGPEARADDGLDGAAAARSRSSVHGLSASALPIRPHSEPFSASHELRTPFALTAEGLLLLPQAQHTYVPASCTLDDSSSSRWPLAKAQGLAGEVDACARHRHRPVPGANFFVKLPLHEEQG